MRQMRQDITEHMDKIYKEQMERTMRQQSEMLLSTVRRSPRLASKVPPSASQGPGDRILAEDSDNSLEETVVSGPAFAKGRDRVRAAQENSENPEPPAAKTPQLRMRKTPLRDVTNNAKRDHLRKVEQTASPELKKPGDTACVGNVTPKKSVEEMAAALGIDADSPSLMFSSRRPSRLPPVASPNGTILQAPPQASAAKRSVRRTTMMHKEIRMSTAGLEGLRRSKRCVFEHLVTQCGHR